MSQKLKNYANNNFRCGSLTSLDTVADVIARKLLPLSCCRELCEALKAGQIVSFTRIGDIVR